MKVENEMVDTGNVEITKIDKDSKAPLENVVFEVRDLKGKVVAKVKRIKKEKQTFQIYLLESMSW